MDAVFSQMLSQHLRSWVWFFSPLIYEHELLNWFSNTEKIIPCIPRIYTTCLWNINLLCIVEMLLISLYWPIVFFLCWPYWNFIPKLCYIHKISSRIFLILKILCNCFWKLELLFLWVFCKTHVAPKFSLWNNI